MSQIYGRLWELFVNDENTALIEATEGRQFRITFEIIIDAGAYNSYADIAITGLSRETEAKFFKRGQFIGLKAGYKDNIDFIFKGEIRNIFRERGVTRVICRSADDSVSRSSINQSFGEGVTVVEIIQSCADAMGLPLTINEEDFTDVEPYSSGYNLFKDPKTVLNDLSKSAGFEWVIDNQKLVVVGNKSFRQGNILTISPMTGMVGSPEITEVGCNVKFRLNPKVRFGARLKIDSAFPQINFGNVYYTDVKDTVGEGTYKVFRLKFSGDSYGENWDTEAECLGENGELNLVGT